MEKVYDHKAVEKAIYKKWEDGGFFKPEINPDGKPFTIIMPPPNANGALHVGHAVFVTLEDIMTRYHRMKGEAALWLPGADHAGFETQVVYQKKLEKEGKDWFKIERDDLYRQMLEFTKENKKVMESQLKELGASCDWSREKFTLDPDIVETVYSTFKHLYDDGLVYRSKRVVNWCPKHRTTLSDLETKFVEQDTKLYEIKYGPITVATTRPETMFGDVAVAVHPDDSRYESLIGQEVDLPLTGRKIPVIADKAVDREFGTGAVKVTPAHDRNDEQIGQNHKLDQVEIFNQAGLLEGDAVPDQFKGLKLSDAREKVVEELAKQNLIEEKAYRNSAPVCYKCGRELLSFPLYQWYIAVNKTGEKTGKNLSRDALKAVADGRVKFVSERFEKIFNHWLNNIRDWNISRQITWGIQIPVWYKGDEIHVGEKPKGQDWVQEKDVFDTWFSSGQWPFATLKNTQPGDFEKYYPTQVMETGWDILFFWVARMIMLGLYVNDEVPFETIYLHGLVRDKDRVKMSKSKGNVIDPLGVVDLYGADALRMALVFGTGIGNDVIISEEKIMGQRKFTNKVWNAARFIKQRIENIPGPDADKPEATTENAKWIYKEFEKASKQITDDIENYRFHAAAEALYHFVWDEFCDKCLENTKKDLEAGENAQSTAFVFEKILRLLHPFMPFVTEAIYEEFYPNEVLINQRWIA